MALTDTIHILVTLHGDTGEYVTALAAMYASIRTHTQAALEFWIVHDDTVPPDSLATLADYIGRQDTVRLVDVAGHPDIARVGRECADPRYSPAVIWRVFAAELCGAEKAILLDADLIFLCDIADLWRVDVAGFALSSVLRGTPWPLDYHALIRTPPEKYFRIGVSVLNLTYLRNDARFQATREEFLRDRLPAINALVCLPEQSLFNYYFSDALRPLDVNLCPAGHFNPRDPQAVTRMLARMDTATSMILDLKGWLHRSPFDYFYWCYLLMTPWRHVAYALLAQHQSLALADGIRPQDGASDTAPQP